MTYWSISGSVMRVLRNNQDTLASASNNNGGRIAAALCTMCERMCSRNSDVRRRSSGSLASDGQYRAS